LLIFAINWMTSPWYWWAMWSFIGWGFGLIVHTVLVFGQFGFFGPD